MPDDSNGIYNVPLGTLVNSGDTVLPSQHNPWANDSASAISNRFSKDGRAPATGNWNLNTFRITNLGTPTASADAATKAYADSAVTTPSSFTLQQQGQARANIGADTLVGFRNKIINGQFQEWNYAASQTSSGYGSANRWNNIHSGSTKLTNRAGISPGIFPFPDKFSMQTTVTSVAGPNNFVRTIQSIEDVRTYAGETVTLTFYARTLGADRQMSIEFTQSFGTGGSPSPAVTGINVTKVTLSSTLGNNGFQRYDVVANIPPIFGKVIGTNEDSFLSVNFWYEAGSSFNARTASLGQQSGVFEIMHVSLVPGDATAEDDPFGARSYAEEVKLCERFYQSGNTSLFSYQVASNGFGYRVNLKTKMRSIPTITFSNQAYTNSSALSSSGATENDFTAIAVASATGVCAFQSNYAASAEL